MTYRVTPLLQTGMWPDSEEVAKEEAYIEEDRRMARYVLDHLEDRKEAMRVQMYRTQRLEEEASTILPMFHDYVYGTNITEIEDQVQAAIAKSEEIRQDAAWRAEHPPMAPPRSPEFVAADQQLADQIRDIPLSDWFSQRGNYIKSDPGIFY